MLTADWKCRKKINSFHLTTYTGFMFTDPLRLFRLPPWRTDPPPVILGWKSGVVPGSDDGGKLPRRFTAPPCVRCLNCWSESAACCNHSAIAYRAAFRSDEITELPWPLKSHGSDKMLSHRDTEASYACVRVSDWSVSSRQCLRFTSGPGLNITSSIFSSPNSIISPYKS